MVDDMTTVEENQKNRIQVLEMVLRRIKECDSGKDSEHRTVYRVPESLQADLEIILGCLEWKDDHIHPSPERRKEMDKIARRAFNEGTGGPEVV